MRRNLALGCCVVYLAFGFVAGPAHVHESADHHEEMRGLHLNHVHPDNFADQRESHVDHGLPEDGDTRIDAGHVGHHDGDALYLAAAAVRSPDSRLRVMPATVSVGAPIDTLSTNSDRNEELPDQLRGPPRKDPTRPRAPPA